MHLDREQILVASVFQIVNTFLVNIWERCKLSISDFIGLQSLRSLLFTSKTGLIFTFTPFSSALNLLTVFTFISPPGLLEIGSS